jgi:hypothetical protein
MKDALLLLLAISVVIGVQMLFGATLVEAVFGAMLILVVGSILAIIGII